MKQPSLKNGILLITYAIVLYLVLSNIGLVAGTGSYVLAVLRPVIIGVVTAYIINLLMRPMETKWPPVGPQQACHLHCAFDTGRAGHYHRAVLFHPAAGGRKPFEPGQ